MAEDEEDVASPVASDEEAEEQHINAASFLDDQAADDDEDASGDEMVDEQEAPEDIAFIDDSEKRPREKRSRAHREELDEELDDDDLNVLRENLGGASALLKKKSKFRRLRGGLASDDEAPEPVEADKLVAASLFDEKAGSTAAVEEHDEDGFLEMDETDLGLPKASKRSSGEAAAKSDQRDRRGSQERAPASSDDEYELHVEGQPKSMLHQVYDPEELERRLMTDRDRVIRETDLPERPQLQFSSFEPISEDDCRAEARWILNHALYPRRTSSFHSHLLEAVHRRPPVDDVVITKAIMETISLLRCEMKRESNGTMTPLGPREVPFIQQYRRELVGFPHILNLHALWTIQRADAEYRVFVHRKQHLLSLMEKLREKHEADVYKPLVAVTFEEIAGLEQVETQTELSDWNDFLQFHMREDLQVISNATQRTAANAHLVACQRASITTMLSDFGITAEQIGRNLAENMQLHPTKPCEHSPEIVARNYLMEPMFDSVERVIKAAVRLFALFIANNPTVRSVLRESFFSSAVITVRPSPKGLREIDDWSRTAQYRYMTAVPVRLLRDEDFAWIVHGEKAGLLQVTIKLPTEQDRIERAYSYLEDEASFIESKFRLFNLQQTDQVSMEWNALRIEAFRTAVTSLLFPRFQRELRERLLAEALQCVGDKCANFIRWPLNHAAPKMDPEASPVVVSIALGDKDVPSYAVAVDQDGHMQGTRRFDWLLVKVNQHNERSLDAKRRNEDMDQLKAFILDRQPSMVLLAADGATSIALGGELQMFMKAESMGERFSFVNPALARFHANSNVAQADLPELDVQARQAVYQARHLLQPVLSIASLVNMDQDILGLRMHPLQEMLQQKTLLELVTAEVISAVNRVGVPINKCFTNPLYAHALQFVSGLGPRKAGAIAAVRGASADTPFRFVSREHIRWVDCVGPTVWYNCVGFLILDDDESGITEDDEGHDIAFDPLDVTRAHPVEGYPIARKICMEAFNDDKHASDGALYPSRDDAHARVAEVIEHPEDCADQLKALSLDEFSRQLRERHSEKDLHLTLEDIRNELLCPFKDMRHECLLPKVTTASLDRTFQLAMMDKREFFACISGLTLDAKEADVEWIQNQVGGGGERDELALRPPGVEAPQLHEHQVVECRLRRLVFRHTIDINERGECRSCRQRIDDDMHGSHRCPFSISGAIVSIFETLEGFLPGRELIMPGADRFQRPTDDELQSLYVPGYVFKAEVSEVDFARCSVKLKSAASDEARVRPVPDDDTRYDIDAERADLEKLRKLKDSRKMFVKRLIAHPNFKNMTSDEATKALADKPAGTIIVRPSSQSVDKLVCSWKVTDKLIQHLTIDERDKPRGAPIGNRLVIDDSIYEDLDEVLARHVMPMADLARSLAAQSKYFLEGTKEEIEARLADAKRKTPARVPYFVSPVVSQPGSYWLSYFTSKFRRELVSLTPKGYLFRHIVHASPAALISWFKKNAFAPIREPVRQQEAPQSEFFQGHGGAPMARVSHGAHATAPPPPGHRAQPGFQQPRRGYGDGRERGPAPHQGFSQGHPGPAQGYMPPPPAHGHPGDRFNHPPRPPPGPQFHERRFDDRRDDRHRDDRGRQDQGSARAMGGWGRA